MKREHAERGHMPRPCQNSRDMRHCLPFCGLGAERAVLGGTAARALSPVPLETRGAAQAGGVDAPTRS